MFTFQFYKIKNKISKQILVPKMFCRLKLKMCSPDVLIEHFVLSPCSVKFVSFHCLHSARSVRSFRRRRKRRRRRRRRGESRRPWQPSARGEREIQGGFSTGGRLSPVNKDSSFSSNLIIQNETNGPVQMVYAVLAQSAHVLFAAGIGSQTLKRSADRSNVSVDKSTPGNMLNVLLSGM